MPGKIKRVKQAIKTLEIANAVYKMMGATGQIKSISEGPRLYSCSYSVDKPDAIDFGKLMKKMGGNLVTIGNNELNIDIPKINQTIIELKKLISSPEFKKAKNILPIVLGVNTTGKPMIGDLAKMPHVLVTGQAGSGKSTFLKTIYESLIRKMSPATLKFIIIDSKNADFVAMGDNKYLLRPVIKTPSGAISALESVVDMMNERYKTLKSAKVKNIAEYQRRHRDMPYVVVMIDELSDLTAKNRRTVENCIQEITSRARAVGIHLVVATRDFSHGNLSDLIRANLPAVITFKTRDGAMSRRILGTDDAEKLLSFGDILFSNAGRIPVRIHTAYTR